MSHEHFLREAVRLSHDNVQRGAGGPFGAVIVQKGEIIAQGQNRVTQILDPTAHAEVMAIRAACQNLGTFALTGCVLYSSCEPCPMCLAAAYWARLDAVYFAATQTDAARAGFDDAFLYRELVLPIGERSLPTVGVPELQAEADEVFAAWNLAIAKTRY